MTVREYLSKHDLKGTMIHMINVFSDDLERNYDNSYEKYLATGKKPMLACIEEMITDFCTGTVFENNLPEDVYQFLISDLEVIGVKHFSSLKDYEKNHREYEVFGEELLNEEVFPMSILYVSEEAYYDIKAAFKFFDSFSEWLDAQNDKREMRYDW